MIFSIIVKGSALPQLTVTMIWELPEKFRKSKLKIRFSAELVFWIIQDQFWF